MWEPQGLYSKFILKQPTILHGVGAVRGLCNYPCSRVAVVYGAGLTTDFKEIIIRSVKSFEIKFIKKSWIGEPDMNSMRNTVGELELFKPDLIIAVGGGSVIDGVKVARLFYEFPFFEVNVSRFNFLEWKTKFIAIPTTIGSGSEVSSAAVMINKEHGNKEMIICHSFIPDVIVFDPSLIGTVSQSILITSAIDAMAHIIEGYVSSVDNAIADIYAEKALFELVKLLKEEEHTYTDNEILRMQFSGYLGGIVQNHCIVGAAHAIAHQLSAFGYGHAEAIAKLLPSVIEVNASNNLDVKERYNALARRCGFDDYRDIVAFIGLLNKRVGCSGLNQFKSLIQQLSNSDRFIANVIADKGGKGNPIPLTDEYIKQILSRLMQNGE